MRLLFGFAFFCGLAWAQDTEPLPPRPAATPENRAAGEKLFQGHCSPCHGPRGDGGRGANLAQPKLRRASNIEELFRVIQRGVPGTEMPSAWQMNGREVWLVTAFVESLGKQESAGIPGDPVQGELLFRGKANCLQCHTAEVQGGLMGPELTDIGARRSIAYLRRALLDPEADLPERFMQMRLTLPDGQVLSGIRLNEDTFTVQIRDFSDQMHSLRKEEVASIDRQRKSTMPSYKDALSETELTDLLAYLVTLRGEP